jgi:hypothetical protein
VCHQIGTPQEAQIIVEIVDSEHGGRLDFPLVGLTLPVLDLDVAVDPLYIAITRPVITNRGEIAEALNRGDSQIPVDLGPAPNSTILGRSTPFPGPEAAGDT